MWAGRIEARPQLLGLGVATVADLHLVGHRRTAQQRFRARPVGQLEVTETALAQIVDRVHPPVGAFAARLAQCAGIGDAQAAPGPQRGLCRGAAGQQPVGDRGEKRHRPVQTLVQRLRGELGHAVQIGPGGGLLQALAAGTARQAQTQQGGAVLHGVGARTLDGVGLARKDVEVEIGGEPGRQSRPGFPAGRCCHMHLRYESYRFASRIALFFSPGGKTDAYGA